MRNRQFAAAFGERLRAFRKLRGLTQVELAHRAGCVVGTIHNIENGLTSPAIVSVAYLAEALEVDPKILLFGEEE